MRALCLALLLAGCGLDDAPPSTSSRPAGPGWTVTSGGTFEQHHFGVDADVVADHGIIGVKRDGRFVAYFIGDAAAIRRE